jgi:membrane protein YqaA with SNARE-associated domain
MQQAKLPHWLAHAVAALGGGGLFVVTFFDSSVLSFPLVADLLVIEQSMLRPSRMPYYAAMATLGSLAGCIWLYWIAKKGGEAFYRRRAGPRAEKVRGWVERNAFLSVAVPAILPPPAPFKIFILAAGVFQAPLGTFVLALLAGRGVRYFVEGFLAIRYGEAATHFVVEHKLAFAVAIIALVAVIAGASRWFSRRTPTRS